MGEGDGTGIDLGAKFDAWLEVGRSIKHGIDRLNDRWRARPEVLIVPHSEQAISPAFGDFIFGLGGPAMGRRRMIRQIAVGGSLVTSTPAGTAYILRAGTRPPLTPGMLNFVDITTGALPQRAFYGRGELVLDYPDNVWCLIHNPSATTQYVAAILFEDIELGEGLTEQAP